MLFVRLGCSIRNNLITSSLLAVASGIAVGSTWHLPLLKRLIPFGLFLMLYPAFLDVEKTKILEVMARPLPLISAILINFLVSPVLMFGLAELFSAGMPPGLMIGLLIFGMIPGGGMGPAYTKMADGNINLAVAISTVSLLLSLAAIPLWSRLLIGKIIAVPTLLVLQYLFMIIVLPLVLAVITRRRMIRTRGTTAFESIKEMLQSISGMGLVLMLFIIFVLNGRFVIENFSLIARLLFPTLSFSLLLVIGSACLALAAAAAPRGFGCPDYRFNYEKYSHRHGIGDIDFSRPGGVGYCRGRAAGAVPRDARLPENQKTDTIAEQTVMTYGCSAWDEYQERR